MDGLGVILSTCWPPWGSLGRCLGQHLEKAPLFYENIDSPFVFSMFLKVFKVPNGSSELPNGPPEVPQRVPRGPKWSPRGPKSVPGVPQRSHRGTPELPNGPPEVPQRLQMASLERPWGRSGTTHRKRHKNHENVNFVFVFHCF